MSIKSTLRTLRLNIGKKIIDKKTPISKILTQPKKILFLRHDGKIGDYIVSSFAFREIKKDSPSTYIGVVCSEKNAYLFKQNPYIDRLYLVKTKDICDYIRCGKKLAQEKYDVVIDPTIVLRNRDLIFLRTISAKNYVGYQKEGYQLFNLNINAKNIHYSEIYQKALEIIGFNKISTNYDVPLEPQSEKDIQDFLQENHISNYIALNFFGAGSARRFNDESIKSLLDNLTSNTMNIVLLGFHKKKKKLNSLAKKYPRVFIYEQTKTVFHSIALIKYSDMVISPDTSIVHIAAAFEKPLIAFYSQGQDNFVHWHPNNKAETHILRFHKSVNEIDFTQIKTEWLQAK